MLNVRRFVLTGAACAALIAAPRAMSTSDDAELQLQLASMLFEETRFAEALDAYQHAIHSKDSALSLKGADRVRPDSPPHRALPGRAAGRAVSQGCRAAQS